MAAHLGVSLGKLFTGKFADGEVKISLEETVREKDVYVLQSTCPPSVNDYLVELILMVSTIRRANARRIIVLIPYFGDLR